MQHTSLRPPLAKRMMPMLVIAGVLVIAFAGGYGYRAYRRRANAAARAEHEANAARDAAIVVGIHDRLAPLRNVELTTAPETCGPGIGRLQLVEREWLDWFLDHAEETPKTPFDLRSPGFDAAFGRNWRSDEQRNHALNELLAAKYIAIATVTQTPMVIKGSSFEGGTVDGKIWIVEPGRQAKVACSTTVSSAPMFVLALQQSTARDTASMQSYEANRQAKMEFWEQAQKAVAAVAPDATLVHD